jgi:dTDP-4-dehydrorhamnose 3,5-epimerase
MIRITKLKKIKHPKGDLLHVLKASENDFTGFGEAYFTSINKGDVKGWKKHTKMDMNLVVPVGDVTFYIHSEFDQKSTSVRVNKDNYIRVNVPAGYWMAFEGHDIGLNLILNLASTEHDPSESHNAPIHSYALGE